VWCSAATGHPSPGGGGRGRIGLSSVASKTRPWETTSATSRCCLRRAVGACAVVGIWTGRTSQRRMVSVPCHRRWDRWTMVQTGSELVPCHLAGVATLGSVAWACIQVVLACMVLVLEQHVLRIRLHTEALSTAAGARANRACTEVVAEAVARTQVWVWARTQSRGGLLSEAFCCREPMWRRVLID